jgi:hypothetical protein
MTRERTLNTAVTAEIRAEIARADIRQGTMAALCGWAPMYFSRRMTGQTPWSTDDLETVAGALGIEVSQLTQPRQVAS